ncbi:MAG: 4Fe-4S dicluster domain-containing protein [bacterium]|nr:4Fe-4S dicluster domain-containing protein [bacterium]
MNCDSTKIGRRQFLKILAGLPASAALGSAGVAAAETQRYGLLADSLRCIGCKRCMSACKRWNNLRVERDELATDRETHLNANNWKIINLRADTKNRTKRHYVQWSCQHCIEPACEGVCPVTAITKLPNSAVVINEKKCIGCRYCFQACPWKVPQFDFEKRVTRKCHFCYNRTLLNYQKPACVAACPVGALAFDYKHEIILEAHRRVERLKRPSHIMGLAEAGGTDLITILPAEPKDLGLIAAPKKVINHNLDKIRVTASGILAASAIAGAMYVYAQMTQDRDEEFDEQKAE